MTDVCRLCGSAIPEGIDTCPQCGAKVLGGQVVAGVRAATNRGLTSRLLRVVVPVVVLIGLYAYYGEAFREYHPVIAQQPEVGAPDVSGRMNSTLVEAHREGPFFIISLSEVRDHAIVRFMDPEGVQDIPVLAYLTPSGRLVTAMSISEGCRSRDFYLEGENIHCANCASYWNASSLEAYACCQKYYPDPIPSTILGDEIRIEVGIVRGWQARS